MNITDTNPEDRARAVATTAHKRQSDQAGEQYIGHPQRVAERVRVLCAEEAPQLASTAVPAAWLHDVLEDTSVTRADLHAAGVSGAVIQTVEAVTRIEGELVEAYAARIAAVPAAVLVKRADLADNTDPERLGRLDLATRTRLEDKYETFRQMLGRALSTTGEVVLCDYRSEVIDIHVKAHLDGGRIVLEGQDLGPNVEAIWGDSDYEYWLTLDRESVEALSRRLKTDDVLGHLALWCTGPEGMRRLRGLCDEARITYDFSSYV